MISFSCWGKGNGRRQSAHGYKEVVVISLGTGSGSSPSTISRD